SAVRYRPAPPSAPGGVGPADRAACGERSRGTCRAPHAAAGRWRCGLGRRLSCTAAPRRANAGDRTYGRCGKRKAHRTLLLTAIVNKRARGSVPLPPAGFASDDPVRLQPGDPVGVVDEAVDLLIVLAERGGGRADGGGSLAEARYGQVHRDRAHLLIRRLDQDAALLDVRILHQLRDVVDRRRGDTLFLEEGDVLGQRALPDPAADDAVHHVAALDALGIGREVGIGI